MTKLSSSQLDFLRQHGIPADRLFDAGGKRTAEWKAAMKNAEAWIAYGANPCAVAGHTLRSRAGHCVQCTPANLSYLRRFDESGELYVAHSIRGEIVKVGMSINASERIGQLNMYAYGGRTDWKLDFKIMTTEAGRVEVDAHRSLAS